MPKGKKPIISDENVKALLIMRDQEGFTFDRIAQILGYERSTVSNTYHRVKGTEVYHKARERVLQKAAERAERGEYRSGSAPLAKVYEEEFKNADIRRLWKVLQGTSKIERGEYAA